MRRLGFLLLFCSGLAAYAQTGLFSSGSASVSFKAIYTSKYLFRGHLLHDDTAYQGEFGLGIGKFAYSLVYTEAADERVSGSTQAVAGLFLGQPFLLSSEYNHNLSFTQVTGKGVTTMGYQYFDYSGLLPDTQEFYVRYSRPTKWNPTYGLSYDFDTYKGYFFDFSLNRNLPLTRRSQLLFSLRGALTFDMDEETAADGTLLEPGFFADDGYTHTSFHMKYIWQIRSWFKVELGGLYQRAEDDLLYEEPLVDRGQTVWHGLISVSFPK